MKKHHYTVVALLFLMLPCLQAQKYFTKSGKVSFFSEAPLENIEAYNAKAMSVLDASSGAIEFAVLIKAFQFEKALMQEHFNESYLESSKYPKSTFKGQIVNMQEVRWEQPGKYPVTVRGELTIHGVTQSVETQGTFTVAEDKAPSAEAIFEVALKDYNVKIPSVVSENIAEIIEIRVDIDYEPL